MTRTRPCRWCGRKLLLEDDVLTISHEAPECAEFQKLIAAARARGMGPAETRVTYRDEQGREIKPGKA